MEEEYGKSVPDVLNAEAFIAARLKELTALTAEIGKEEKVTTIFQRLPKHMRRRAMSHTIKRVPRNLRASHKKQLMKNNALKKPKKAKKRHRKRPKQLLLEYNRRQRINTWLETHIWHAKRFRMSTKWNYRIAESSYEKTFKAVYRATTTHCLAQDISYYCCIELHGCANTLIDTFKLITNPACGLSIAARCWLGGNREGNITIFHANSYPYNVIGNINFIWKPLIEKLDTRTLWLWCHPSMHEEIVQELVEIFNLSKDTSKDSEMGVTYTDVGKGVTMVLLKDKLNRIRLTGPLSNAVLTKALHSAEIFDNVLLKSLDDAWWSKFRHEIVESGNSLELLKKYPRPFLFPPHCILGCNIVDPRLFLKRVKSKAVPENEGCGHCSSVPLNFVCSAIWQSEIRDDVSTRKLSSAKLDSLRSELLIPGFDDQLLKTVNNVIPILLIQRPGVNVCGIKSNYSCGWDIIIPSNWAMPVWLSLILCGARAGGLRETRTINFESQKMFEMCPDSKAGKEYYDELKSSGEDSYFKKPPEKRTNYLKFGIPTPFHHDWALLVREWCAGFTGSYFVLRNRCLLQQVQEYIRNFRRVSNIPFSLPSNSLIPVIVTMLDKGRLIPFSHICMPSQSDVTLRVRNKTFRGPNEESHPDMFKWKRRTLKLEHEKELKRLRHKRIKEKKERMKTGLPLKIKKRKNSPTEPEVQAYLRQMRDLWIPAKVTKLRKNCAREVCGFVVTSGFSFLKSCVTGQGYIIGKALITLFEEMKRFNSDLVVLTRSPSSLNYRFCKINIIVQYSISWFRMKRRFYLLRVIKNYFIKNSYGTQ